ncbi:Palmitoyl-protein thioesterase 1 [Gurleya vavrai]
MLKKQILFFIIFQSIYSVIFPPKESYTDAKNFQNRLSEIEIDIDEYFNLIYFLINKNQNDFQKLRINDLKNIKNLNHDNKKMIDFLAKKVSESYYDLADLYYKFKNYEMCLDFCKKHFDVFQNNKIQNLIADSTIKAGRFYDNCVFSEFFLKDKLEYMKLLPSDKNNILETYRIEKLKNSEVKKILGHQFNKSFFDERMKEYKISKNLDIKNVNYLFYVAKNIFENLENISFVDSNKDIYVFGDTRGKFYETFETIYEINGLDFYDCDEFNLDRNKIFIFNGNLVDSLEPKSVENFFFLTLLKIVYPQNIFLNRGDQEISVEKNNPNFIDTRIWRYTMTDTIKFDRIKLIFQLLPLATIINRKILVMHGGLPYSSTGLKTLFEYNRNIFSIEKFSYLNEILFNKPDDLFDESDTYSQNWESFVTRNFLEFENLDLIIRSKNIPIRGYELNHKDKILTITSAPNFKNFNRAFCVEILSNNGLLTVYDPAKFTYKEIKPTKNND